MLFRSVLTRAQLDEIEDEANAIVAACLPVKAYYPAPEELSAMTYRAKLDLTEGVRIVRIGTEDAPKDLCACCAPHVDYTGEIGLIKLLTAERHRGGVRLTLVCGMDALDDYRRKLESAAASLIASSKRQICPSPGAIVSARSAA